MYPFKVLVTGGAGYIGSHMVKLLLSQNCEVHIIDDLSMGRKENILGGTLHQINLVNDAKVEEVLATNSFDAVFHFAGSIIVPESILEPIQYYENNSFNSLKLLKLVLKYKIKSFIFSSTAAVYGNPSEVDLIPENFPTLPTTPYGHSKLIFEKMLHDAHMVHPFFNYVCLRYFNVAGADIKGQIGQSSKISTHLVKRIAEKVCGKNIHLQLFGTDYPTADGTCIRDYIHVEDLVMAHWLAFIYLEKEKKSNIFNCGYGKGFSVFDIIHASEHLLKRKFDYEIGPRRPGDVPKLVCNPGKIMRELNWSPLYKDINIILESAFNWEKKLLGTLSRTPELSY